MGLLMFQAGRCKHIPEKHFKGETVAFHAFLWFVGNDDYSDAGGGDECNDVELMVMMLVVMMNMGTP